MPKFKPLNSRGFDCVNVLVQRAIGKVKTRANDRRRASQWARDNPAKINSRNKSWAAKNKDKVDNKQRVYRAANRGMINQKERDKYANNIMHNLKVRLRARLRLFMRGSGAKKPAATFDLIGCTPQQLVDYLETTIDDGEDDISTFELDHVFPLCRYGIQDSVKMTNYRNLQLLHAFENNTKNDKLPTKAMAARVPRELWPDGVTEDMLPDIYDGWATPLRMRAPAAAPRSPPDAN